MSRTVSHIRIRYSKSRLISGLVREAPAVRRMMPMPSGTSRSCTTSFSRERSWRRGDLAADAAAAGGVGHQHGIAAGQRQIGRQRRALVAALFLDDLHQHHLAALDDFLDLVLAARAEGALRHFLQHVVAADGFDDFLFGVLVVVFIVVVVVAFGRARRARRAETDGVAFAGVLDMRRVVGMGRVFVRVLVVVMLVMRVSSIARRVGRGRLDRRHGGRAGFRFRDRGFACGICAWSS